MLELQSLKGLWHDRLLWERATQCLLQVVSPVWLLLSPPEPGAHSPTAAGGSSPCPASAALCSGGNTSASEASSNTPAGTSSSSGATSAASPAAPAAPLLSVSPSACGVVCELLVSAGKAVQGAAMAVRQLRGVRLVARQQQQQQGQVQKQPCRSDPAGGAAHVSQQEQVLGAYGVHTSAGSHTQQQLPSTHGGPGCSGAGTATTTTTTATASSHSVPPVSTPNWAWLAHNVQVLEAEQRHWVDAFQDVPGTLLVLVLTGRQSWLLTVPEPSAPELRALDPASRRASGASPGGSSGWHGPVVACGQDQAAALRGAAAYLMCVVGRTALEELREVEGGLEPLLALDWEKKGVLGAEATRQEEQGRADGGVPMRGQVTGQEQGQGQGDNTQHGDSGTAREIGQGPLQQPLQQQPHQEQWALLRDITSRLFYLVGVLPSYVLYPLCDWLPGGRGHVAWLLPPPRSLQRLLVGSCRVLLRTTRAAASLPPSPEHTANVKRTSHWCVVYLLGALLRLSCHVVLGPQVRRWLGRPLGELAGEVEASAMGAAAGGAGGRSQTVRTDACEAAATARAQHHGAPSPGPEGLTLVGALAELAGSVGTWQRRGGGNGNELAGLVDGLARAASGEQRAAEEEEAEMGMGVLGRAAGARDGGGVGGGSGVGEEAFREAARALVAELTRLFFGAEALPPSLQAQRGKAQLGERQVEQGDANGGAEGGVDGRGEVWGWEGVLVEVEVEAPRVCGNPECVNFEGDAEGALKFRRCGGCGAVRYCGADCQRAHWRAGHREECRS